MSESCRVFQAVQLLAVHEFGYGSMIPDSTLDSPIVGSQANPYVIPNDDPQSEHHLSQIMEIPRSDGEGDESDDPLFDAREEPEEPEGEEESGPVAQGREDSEDSLNQLPSATPGPLSSQKELQREKKDTEVVHREEMEPQEVQVGSPPAQNANPVVEVASQVEENQVASQAMVASQAEPTSQAVQLSSQEIQPYSVPPRPMTQIQTLISPPTSSVDNSFASEEPPAKRKKSEPWSMAPVFEELFELDHVYRQLQERHEDMKRRMDERLGEVKREHTAALRKLLADTKSRLEEIIDKEERAIQ